MQDGSPWTGCILVPLIPRKLQFLLLVAPVTVQLFVTISRGGGNQIYLGKQGTAPHCQHSQVQTPERGHESHHGFRLPLLHQLLQHILWFLYSHMSYHLMIGDSAMSFQTSLLDYMLFSLLGMLYIFTRQKH